MNIQLVGDSALLVEVEDASAAQQLREIINRQSLRGIRELVPAYDTLLVEFDPLRFNVVKFMRWVTRFEPQTWQPAVVHEHEIMVAYRGEDIEDVSRITGLDVAEVIRRHSAPVYTVAFLGFAPGFAYLTGLDPKLKLPRLKSPRTHVSAGSVAIADEFSGVYPQSAPGGWRIVGHTDSILFDVSQSTPALLLPGDKLHFRPVA